MQQPSFPECNFPVVGIDADSAEIAQMYYCTLLNVILSLQMPT
jgi:hypothetical protein